MSGQVWVWVVLAVVVIALVAVLLMRSRQEPPDGARSAPGEVVPSTGGAVAAAAGAVGAVGAAGAVAAATRTGADEPADASSEGTAPHGDTVAAERQAVAPKPPPPSDSALAALDAGLINATGGTAAASAAQAVAAAATRPGPHPGSALPPADGSSPSDVFPIKANEGSHRYHTPDSPYFVRTRADLWFHSATEAEQAGFTAWNASRSA